jgi:hypothetical protein
MSSWEITSTTVNSDEASYDYHEANRRRLPLHESTSITGFDRHRQLDHRPDECHSGSVSDTENDPRALHHPRRLYYQNGEVHFRKTGNRRRTRPEDFHTVYRTPHHVPDRKFKDYLLGQQGFKQQAKRPPMVTEESVTQSCFGFSLVAVVFLLWVGMLFDRQPLYIRGSLPVMVVSSSTKSGRLVSRYLVPDASDSRLVPATVSYHAAFAYVLTAGFCLYRLNRGWVHDKIKKRRSRYEDIPDHSAPFLAGDYAEIDEVSSSVLPMFRRQNEGGASTTAYQLSAWSRMKAGVLQWFVVRGWFYRPVHKFRRKREPKCV